ncbi:hypothetical protein BDZ89DRAFT_1116476 [Hymenopellis radicata]|nr:hypothetical protein BDZ89DRAFT_1116476 [Hymenopellis radicata]
MVITEIVNRYQKLGKESQIILVTPPAIRASRRDLLPFLKLILREPSSMQSDFVQTDSHGFSRKWHDLEDSLRKRHYCPRKRDRCQGPHCSAALDEFGKWDSDDFTLAVHHIWDDDLKMLCIGIFSNMNDMHGYRRDVQSLYRAIPRFIYDLNQFSTRLLEVHHMTSGISEWYDVEQLFQQFRLLVVLVSHRLSRRLSSTRCIEPEHIKDLFLEMQNKMTELYQSKSPLFRFVMGWNVEEVLASANTNTNVVRVFHPDTVWHHLHYMERYNRGFSCGKEVKRFYKVSTAVVALHSKIRDLRRDGFMEGSWEAEDRVRDLMSALEMAGLKLAAIVVLQRQEHKGAAGPMGKEQINLFIHVGLAVKSISTAAEKIQQSLKDMEKRSRKQRQRPAQRPTPGPSGHARGW